MYVLCPVLNLFMFLIIRITFGKFVIFFQSIPWLSFKINLLLSRFLQDQFCENLNQNIVFNSIFVIWHQLPRLFSVEIIKCEFYSREQFPRTFFKDKFSIHFFKKLSLHETLYTYSKTITLFIDSNSKCQVQDSGRSYWNRCHQKSWWSNYSYCQKSCLLSIFIGIYY